MRERELIDIFGDNLRYVMNNNYMTQRELADASGLDESVISRYLRKQVMPSTRCLINLAVALDCSIEDLIPCYELVY